MRMETPQEVENAINEFMRKENGFKRREHEIRYARECARQNRILEFIKAHPDMEIRQGAALASYFGYQIEII